MIHFVLSPGFEGNHMMLFNHIDRTIPTLQDVTFTIAGKAYPLSGKILVFKPVVFLNVWNQNRHGFRKGRPCLSQLLEHHQKIVERLENSYMVDIVYLDSSKSI